MNVSITDIPYFPFTGEPYKPSMGVKPLNLEHWIEVDDQYPLYIQKKIELFNTRSSDVLGVLPEAAPGIFELHAILKSHLSQVFPDKFKRLPSGELQLTETHPATLGLNPSQLKPHTEAEQALLELSLWTQEDWALMHPRPPVQLSAGSICFPSRWSLQDKLGKVSDQIHTPVPKFETIAKPTQSFLERIQPEKPMWRLNWSIHDNADLFAFPGEHSPKLDLHADQILNQTFLRVERQTLRKLPQSEFIAFSIRTYIHPMSQVAASAERRALTLKSLELLDMETAHYRGMKHFFELLKEALAKG